MASLKQVSNDGKTVTVTKQQHIQNQKNSRPVSGNGTKVGSGSSVPNVNTISYDKNKDYAAEIQKAQQSGASQEYINQLNAERNAKIKGENLNYGGLTDSDLIRYANPMTPNNNGFTYNPTYEQWQGLPQSVPYDSNNPKGYADPSGYYTNRENAFTWTNPDGTTQTTFSNATNYEQAYKDAVAAGQIQNGATLAHADTYGTGSLSGNSFNYGVTSVGDGKTSGFGNGSDGGRYTADGTYSNQYQSMNHQLDFLSGRDGYDYTNPYYDNHSNSAYNKGLEFAGQGEIMGQYPLGQPSMDDILAGYGQNGMPSGGMPSGGLEMPEYQGVTKQEIDSQMNDIMAGYDEAVRQAQNAIRANYDKQRNDVTQNTEDAQQENYINKQLAQLNLPSQLQSMGINGGVAESTLAGIQSDYMNNYNDTASNMNNIMAQLGVAEQQALASGDMQKADTFAQLKQNSLNLQQQAAQAENAFNQWAAQTQISQNQWEREYAQRQAQIAWEQKTQAEAMAKDWEYKMAQMGFQQSQAEKEWQYKQAQMGADVGDFSGYQNLGFDTSYAEALNNAQLAKATAPRTYRSSGGGGNTLSQQEQDTIDNLLGGMPNVGTTGTTSGGVPSNGITTTSKEGVKFAGTLSPNAQWVMNLYANKVPNTDKGLETINIGLSNYVDRGIISPEESNTIARQFGIL